MHIRNKNIMLVTVKIKRAMDNITVIGGLFDPKFKTMPRRRRSFCCEACDGGGKREYVTGMPCVARSKLTNPVQDCVYYVMSNGICNIFCFWT